jgi:hypothetical protein
MKANFFCFGGFLTMLILGSCGSSSKIVNRPVYYDTVITHDKFMRTNYANKVQVFSKYGVANRKDTLQNIEVWYYRLGESTKSQTETINNSKGEVQQNPWNLVLPPISQSVNIETKSTSSGITYSVSTDNYVQFWFQKDSVINYDSKGVDYSVVRVRQEKPEKNVLNKSDIDIDSVRNSESESEKEKRNHIVSIFFVVTGFAVVIYVLVAGTP